MENPTFFLLKNQGGGGGPGGPGGVQKSYIKAYILTQSFIVKKVVQQDFIDIA